MWQTAVTKARINACGGCIAGRDALNAFVKWCSVVAWLVYVMTVVVAEPFVFDC